MSDKDFKHVCDFILYALLICCLTYGCVQKQRIDFERYKILHGNQSESFKG